jgi:cytochrome P450
MWELLKVVSTMTTFFLLMARHPEIQERAREEIDSVLGGNMATHDDCSSMPYVNAMIKEILRWGPVAPLGNLKLC